MRMLVLGGTQFLSREIARQAVDAGHDVTCAARGESGSAPDGTAFVRWDRNADAPEALRDTVWDAVVDVSRVPSHVARAIAGIRSAHWVFISTISVYADQSVPGATTDAATLPPVTDTDGTADLSVYGELKVACERLVRAGTASSVILRPGLIVGPGDPTGRFTYWPMHAAAANDDGDALLVPGSADAPVQVIDVRDLAAFTVLAAASRLTGVLDATSPAMTRTEFVDAVTAGVGATDVARTHADAASLERLGVAQWNGPESIPVWVDDLSMAGFMARDVSATLAAGLDIRPLAETARDTLAWVRSTADAAVAGISRAREREVLAALREAGEA